MSTPTSNALNTVSCGFPVVPPFPTNTDKKSVHVLDKLVVKYSHPWKFPEESTLNPKVVSPAGAELLKTAWMPLLMLVATGVPKENPAGRVVLADGTADDPVLLLIIVPAACGANAAS